MRRGGSLRSNQMTAPLASPRGSASVCFKGADVQLVLTEPGSFGCSWTTIKIQSNGIEFSSLYLKKVLAPTVRSLRVLATIENVSPLQGLNLLLFSNTSFVFAVDQIENKRSNGTSDLLHSKVEERDAAQKPRPSVTL